VVVAVVVLVDVVELIVGVVPVVEVVAVVVVVLIVTVVAALDVVDVSDDLAVDVDIVLVVVVATGVVLVVVMAVVVVFDGMHATSMTISVMLTLIASSSVDKRNKCFECGLLAMNVTSGMLTALPTPTTKTSATDLMRATAGMKAPAVSCVWLAVNKMTETAPPRNPKEGMSKSFATKFNAFPV